MTDAYQDCLDFLYGRLNFERTAMPRGGSELRLGRMRRLLRRLGDPQDALRIVHVAGTKGKGSTAAMIAAALAAGGLRTGLFCSPHLHRLEERFRVDGQEVTPGELVALTEAVRPAVVELDARALAAGGRGPTFFEVTTALGLLHFARRRADAVLLEVGMGGRLDSTNAVRPLVSVITSISFDHTRQLGRTLGAIAREKAGILKRGVPSLSGVVETEPRAVIRQVAASRRSRLRELGVDFSYRFLPPEPPLRRPEPGAVQVQTWRSDWGPLDLPMPGPHQAHNAAVALATLDLLAEQGIEVAPEAVARGFAGLKVPARVEVLGESPWLIVDGAHNVAAAGALAETLRVCMPAVPRTLVFGTTREKDLDGQLLALCPLFERFVATQYVENPRAVPAAEVAAAIRSRTGQEAALAGTPAEALAVARQITPAEGLICVTGSLFLAAETRARLLGLEPAERAAVALPLAVP